ncbi:MAG: peptidylprolyl isomerase [Thermoanaerobaculia bacterium]
MKKTTLALLILLAALPASAAEIVEAIVARVGDRIITRSQYTNRLQDGLEEIEKTVPPAERPARIENFRKTLLDDMLSELLLKDRADRLGLAISDAEVKDATKRLMAQYGLKTDAEFEDSLKKSGLTRPEMEARLRDTLLTNKVFSRELRSRSDMTDKELRDKYAREKESYRLPERATVREIIIVIPEAPTASAVDALRERAAQAAARAKAGEDFAKLVAEYSDAPSKERGGDIGNVNRGELLGALDQAVFNADAGTIAGPIETRFGFHILKIEQRLPSEIPSFDTIKEQLRQDASEETFQRDYRAYIESLRKEAFIQVNTDNLPKI